MIEEGKTQNFVMLAWLETVEAIVGSNGLKSILNYGNLHKYISNFPPNNEEKMIPVEDLQRLLRSLIDLFGGRGAQALQTRAGREFARSAVEKHPAIASAVKAAARLLPETKRMRLVLEKWTEEVDKREPSQVHNPRVELREDDSHFIYTDWDNYLTEGLKSDAPVCSFYVGELKYLVEWITGHEHEVIEIECRALGHSADVFRISKKSEE